MGGSDNIPNKLFPQDFLEPLQNFDQIFYCIHIKTLQTCINILAERFGITINWDFSPYTETLTLLVSYSSVVNHTELYSAFNFDSFLRQH